MAEDKTNNTEGTPENEEGEQGDFGALSGDPTDSDFGNLPPLSEFESTESGEPEADSKLPPLEKADDESGGLPALGDIDVETPIPTGGAIKAPPPGYEDVSDFGAPPSDSDLETPQPSPTGPEMSETPQPDLETPQSDSGAPFQDLTADSDFSPETPEIGPGPDSDLETPMFDSAFGGGKEELAVAPDTSAPTQAMETPMFGEEVEGAEGTPVPDFSPDTGVGVVEAPPIPTPPPGEAVGKAAKRGGPVAIAINAAIFLLAALIGIVAGPYLSTKLPLIPNPLRSALTKAEEDLASAEDRLDTLRRTAEPGDEPKISPEELDRLIRQREQLTKELGDLRGQRSNIQQELQELEAQFALVSEDINLKNEDFVTAKDQYDQLADQLSIVRAQQAGFMAEVDRLQELVGLLEDANSRRLATKDTLVLAADRLAILVREGIPLAPQKYARDQRLGRVEALRNEVADAKWVSSRLLNEFSSLFLAELEIAAGREYFFARVPVNDRYGALRLKYAECLMNGNWSVYYRTFDGKNIGSYENVAETGGPEYEFREDLPTAVKKRIEQDIIAARVDGYQDRARILAQKELMSETKTPIQRVFDSL